MQKTNRQRFKRVTRLILGAVIGLILIILYQALNTSDSANLSSSFDSEENIVTPVPEVAEIKAQLHQKMDKGRRVSRAKAWDALAEGARSTENMMTLFYTRRTILQTARASGESQSEPDYWNREHLWPRSFGLKGTAADFDLHNLVPVDRTVNSSRGNKVFGLANSPHHECEQCRVSSAAWEPPDEVKGDIARVLFYMDVRYSIEQNLGTAQNSADLALREIPNASRGHFGPLSTLLSWHCQDGVSDEEIMRQETIFRYQDNRNLFVDDPELVEDVYGIGCDAVVVTSSDALD